jgi:GntR family transcriptional regulator
VTDVPYVPHHRRIEQALRERIAGLQPGERLPSDAELRAEFGVSRMTARNAMQRLADEGLIARRPGRGSFVAQPPAHRRANRLMTFTQEMLRRGLRPSSVLLARTVRPATPAEAAALGLGPHEPVVHLRRLRCADDRPMALETSVLIGACADAVLGADLERGSLHEALLRAGFSLRRGTGTIGSEPANDDDARLLDLEVGQPLLVERRVIADPHGQLIEATESRYPGDRYWLDVTFDVEEPDLQTPAGGRG